jgi:hypothetical protein
MIALRAGGPNLLLVGRRGRSGGGICRAERRDESCGGGKWRGRVEGKGCQPDLVASRDEGNWPVWYWMHPNFFHCNVLMLHRECDTALWIRLEGAVRREEAQGSKT